jgi:hypothetical protein
MVFSPERVENTMGYALRVKARVTPEAELFIRIFLSKILIKYSLRPLRLCG